MFDLLVYIGQDFSDKYFLPQWPTLFKREKQILKVGLRRRSQSGYHCKVSRPCRVTTSAIIEIKRTQYYWECISSPKVMSRAPRWNVVKYTSHWNPTTRRLRKPIKNMRCRTSHMTHPSRPAMRNLPIETMP